MKKLLFATVVLLALSATASADMAVRLQEGALTQDFFSAPGTTSFTAQNVAFGDFLISNISGASSPSTQAPVLLSTNSLDIQNTATGPHILQVFITGNNLTSPTGLVDAFSGFTSVTLSNGWIATLQSLVDPGNANFTGNQIDQTTFTGTGVGTFAQTLFNTVDFGAGPFSLTAHYSIATNGIGQANSGIQIGAVPVPGPIVGAGLPGLLGMLGLSGFQFWRRRKAA